MFFFTCSGISIHASAREATSIIRLTLLSQTISIHASAREATAIFHKLLSLFYEIYLNISEFTFTYALKYPVYVKVHSNFVYFFRCESPGNFMYASHSHLQIIKTKVDRPRFHVLSQYVPLWFYNYFQDNRSANYPPYHQ